MGRCTSAMMCHWRGCLGRDWPGASPQGVLLQVTLMDWGNCIMREVEAGPDGTVTAITGELHLEGDFKKTKLKLTWLADVPDVVPLRLVSLGYLITKAKVRRRPLVVPLLRSVAVLCRCALSLRSVAALCHDGDRASFATVGGPCIHAPCAHRGKGQAEGLWVRCCCAWVWCGREDHCQI